MAPKARTPAKPPTDWASNPNRSSIPTKQTQSLTAGNPTYFQCSDCAHIATVLGDLGRHWGQDSENHDGVWFTERAHMFKRENEGEPHIEYYCFVKTGKSILWKRCNGQPLNESEDSSILQRLIDQNGIEYVEINGTHVKAHAASHTEGRDSDEEDNEEVDNSALGSTRAPRGRGLRQSTRQTNIASSPNDEASSGHDEHYSTMKQDMSTDNLETHELTHVFIGEDEERSQAADTQTTAAGNLNSSQPSRPTKRGPNILDDTIPARTLQHNLDYGERKPDEDDDEHPDLLSVMKLGLERSRETAVVEDHTRKSQRKQRTSAQSYGGDQGQAQVQYANTHTMSNVGESSAYGSNGMNPYGPFIPTIPHGGKEANHPPSTSGPGSSPLQPTFKPAARRDVLPPDQRPSSRTRHTSRHADIEDLCYRGTDQPTARPTRDERSLSPQERQERQERRTRHDERMFERGRQQGRWEERNAARRFKDAQAECGATDEGEMDEEEG